MLGCVSLAIDDIGGQLEFFDHAKRDGTTTGLGIIHLALKNVGFDAFVLR